jgi:hypothetical protein
VIFEMMMIFVIHFSMRLCVSAVKQENAVSSQAAVEKVETLE